VAIETGILGGMRAAGEDRDQRECQSAPLHGLIMWGGLEIIRFGVTGLSPSRPSTPARLRSTECDRFVLGSG
jgi:hypothetical protein